MIRILIALSCLTGSAVACDEGQSLGEIVARIEAANGSMIDVVDVNGEGVDQILIADFGGMIIVGGFYRTCAVGGPIGLVTSVKRVGV